MIRIDRDRLLRGGRQARQILVEFSLTVGLLMLLAILVAQVAIYLHYRSSLVCG